MSKKTRYTLTLPDEETKIVKEFLSLFELTLSGILSQYIISLHDKITEAKGFYSKRPGSWTLDELAAFKKQIATIPDFDEDISE
ncbi:hypothetical protein [uncultured Desulfobacter sp.]|uniref:hypothetical protein n=1 Tax=uncultured Desulfobacter sp. TaxID=240139 RepID=UPI002AAB5E6B|nr:hypothetical protein [uncultured Desulfobacter sp.]